MKKRLHVAAFLALAACFPACAEGPPPEVPPPPPPPPVTAEPVVVAPEPPPPPPPTFAEIRDQATAEWLAGDPAFSRTLGFHDMDGKVADVSRKALDERVARLQKTRDTLAAVDRGPLSEDEKLDLSILVQHAAFDLFALQELDASRKLPQFYEDIFALNAYVDVPYAPLEERARALVAHEEAALAQVAHIRENLAPRLSRPVAEVSARNFTGFGTYLRGDVAKLMKDAGDQALRDRFAKANEALAAEADKIAAWLKEVAPKGDDSHVLGAERYKKLLAVQEGVTLPLAEFKRMADENLEENRKAFEVLSKKITPRRPKASELLAVAAKQTERARQFVLDHKIVTLSDDAEVKVRETPSYQRWNAASIFMSGPFEKARSAYYQITLPDPAWPKKEQIEYVSPFGVLLATTVHEVYPGHFVQGRWIERAPTKLQKMSGSYSFTEGWAHYTEQMMIDEGFGADDKQNRLGQLSDALLRDCRYLASIGIHTEGMTIDDATKLFMDRCHQDKASAREQAVRGTFDPGYFAYTFGKLQILALRAEAKKALGASFSLQKFHDALLSHGSPPVALIHDRVLRELGADPGAPPPPPAAPAGSGSARVPSAPPAPPSSAPAAPRSR